MIRARVAALLMVCVLLMRNAPAHAWVCTVTISGPSEAVVGETVTLTAAATVPGGSFEWSPTPGLTPAGASATFMWSDPATVTISVTYRNPRGDPCSDSHAIAVIVPTLTIGKPQVSWTFITESETRLANLAAVAKISPDRIHTQFASGIQWELPANSTSGPSTTLTSQGETWTPQIDVPRHGKKGRPGSLSYTFKARVTIFGRTWEATPVTVTQLSPDPVRQQYVDHDIKVPKREDFVNDRIPLKPEVLAVEAATQGAYEGWVRKTRGKDTTYRLAQNRSSTYRTPEYNESLNDRGSKDHSLHQYGYAVDWSPIPDEGGDPGKQDDCKNIRDFAVSSGGASPRSYCAPRATHVHAQWRAYDELPDYHFPNILEQ